MPIEEICDSAGHQRKEWPNKEDNFHLNQVRSRSELRIQHGRAQPIDYIACYAGSISVPSNPDIPSIDEILTNHNIEELEDLLEDITVYQKLEEGKNDNFWRDVTVLTTNYLNKIKETSDPDNHIKTSKIDDLKEDIHKIFKGKTYEEMENLKNQINARVRGSHDIDVDYWNTVLKYLNTTMATTRIAEKYSEYHLKVEQIKSTKSPTPPPQQPPLPDAPEEILESSEERVVEQNPLQEFLDMYKEGNYSPRTLEPSQEYDAVSQEEDMASITLEREFIKELRELERKLNSTRSIKAPRQQLFEEHEEEFREVYQSPLKKNVNVRVKKPRFYNKIYTGYEWDKCTPSQYDTENPPPKIILGYKFNIFYPGFAEKIKRPTYSVNPCEDNKDFSILTFHAGLPYDDISFKIRSAEWSYNNREGFKCQFTKNIFHLYFFFKRHSIR